ncbi:DUF3883 domain-containing protein [Georgenia sp. SYP-B2076]|uniref:DUF3883 domain-containing protein n=1 Tax=Georgenia sp. SYP-B2076 TaxID=2495881 RepID=UPI000F8E2D5B|nr:DUF3883 domain-containing protein [Georgenia sp. SYP-B2076]
MSVQHTPMIRGHKVNRPTKKTDLPKRITDTLDIDMPKVSTGGSVEGAFLDAIQQARTGAPTGGRDTYRKAEQVLETLGLTYDPFWDTSEAAPKGGGTVTARAYSRIWCALTGVPRCFILNRTDGPVGTGHEADERHYRYDNEGTGRQALNDAGPGSRVIICSTSKTENPDALVAHATVEYIAPGWEGPWDAQLADYVPFEVPVPREDVHIDGQNPQHTITEIAWETYAAIVTAGTGSTPPDHPLAAADPGALVAVQRVISENPVTETGVVDVDFDAALPDALPLGRLGGTELELPEYAEDEDGRLENARNVADEPRPTRDPRADSLAEKRAVEIAQAFMKKGGWDFRADRQRDGVGYDLEYEKDGRVLHVEVKGIQGGQTVFNITPKEWWRAQTDETFIVIAVTSVLSPKDYVVNIITRAQITEGRRAVASYRVWPTT